ncbi:hypothetical protein [Vibrio hangzhouensis]|uniref:hypothetical protein n=1 Tax=Vibrio hangzhouensis TaxID=462991 RepID=UPI001C964917|nr:hypothetical protein [Vibrio hangzhouensis]MBY6198127.1 hypothetical protein [Vibrio hangzhouensis]
MGSALADDTVPVSTEDWTISGNSYFNPASSIRLPSVDNECMGDVSSENGISGLNCTANDIRIAEAFDIEIIEGDPTPGDGVDECTINEPVTFTAKFKFELSAQERHDLGVWFATAGQANARTGACLVSTAPLFKNAGGSFINDLDGMSTGYCSNDTSQSCDADSDCKGKNNTCVFTQDYCGDIDESTSPQFFEIEITTECVDKDLNGELDLPVCLSWRQPGADEYCATAEDAYPGAPSKCNCDDDFSVPIKVPTPSLKVYKSISPATLLEPGGTATIKFDIVNPSIYGNDVDILSILDKLDDYVVDQDSSGTITVDDADFNSPDTTLTIFGGTPDVSDLSCVQYDETYTPTPSSTSTPFDLSSDLLKAQEDQLQDPVVKTPNFVRCTFTRYVGGEQSGPDTGIFYDLITVSGKDENNNTTEGEDYANLEVKDKPPKVSLTKTANPTSLTEQQIADGNTDITYTVKISVPSDSDTVTIDCLNDKTLVNSNSQTTVVPYECGTGANLLDICKTSGGQTLAGKSIAPGGSETCTFVAAASGISDTGDILHDRVVVKVSDDENGTASANDIASVTVVNSPPTLLLVKTGAANGNKGEEPSYEAKYTYKITNNTSFNDIVVLNKLVDDITLVDGTKLPTLNITGSCKDTNGDTLLTAQEAPVELAKGESFTCTLTRLVGLDTNAEPAGDAPGLNDTGNTEDNTATITGYEKGYSTPITWSDSASLGFADALPTATVKKDVTQMTVVYKVTVSNTSNEPLDLTALVDQIGNAAVDITHFDYDPPNGLPACDVSDPFELAAKNDGNTDDYVCYFSRTFDTVASTSPIIDTIIATAEDDEGNKVKPEAKAEVSWVSNYVPSN